MFLQCFIGYLYDRMLSSLRDGAAAARKAHNLEVGGANPPPATYRICKDYTKGIDMDRKAELRNAIEKARDELRRIESEENIAQSKELIGKFFKYRNRYSDGEGWWLYLCVIGISESGSIKVRMFQKDTYGKVDFEEETYNPNFIRSGYAEIGEIEFWVAFNDIMSELNKWKE